MFTAKAVAGNAIMSTAMLPFLYQTRTLSGLFLTTPSFRLAAHARTSSRHLSSSVRKLRAFNPDEIPFATASKQIDSNEKTPVRKVFLDLKPHSASNRRSIPQSDGRVYDGERHIFNSARPDTTEDFDVPMPTTIDFEGVNENQYRPKESTITSREKMAFQKIFSDIFERSKKSSSLLQSGRPDISPLEDSPRTANLPRTANRAKVKTALDSILSNAILQQPKTRQQIEQAVSTFPPALREDAARAMLMSNGPAAEGEEVDHEAEKATQEALRSKAEELESMRAPERLRVETLMRGAETDFELWDIMEKEVFSMISRLGLDENPKPTPKIERMKGWKRQQKKLNAQQPQDHVAQDEPHNEELGDKTENGIPPLQLLGPLYPAYLLLGLRLLDRSFAKPSPLALSILPKVKSLGFISHVLGASTQLYNDLLRIYRYRYDDFLAMIGLLGEMEQSALDMDEETLTIVIDVMKMQASVKNFERGAEVKALWAMPEFAPRRFTSWKDKISQGIDERKSNASTQIY